MAVWAQLLVFGVVWAAGTALEEGDAGLCGLNGCQAIDLARRHTDLTMAKMMHTIKPEAMEEVFASMSKLEALVRQVEDLKRDTSSLLQPGEDRASLHRCFCATDDQRLLFLNGIFTAICSNFP